MILGIFLDIETNGLDPFQHEPLEIACAIIDLATGEEKAQYQSIIYIDEHAWNKTDPNSIAVNGMCRSQVENAKTKDVVQADIIKLFSQYPIQRGCAFFICQNPSFDRPFFSKIIPTYLQEQMRWPYHWLDLASMYWAKEIIPKKDYISFFQKTISMSKDTIAAAMNLEKEPYPHKAIQGVSHLILCYEKLVGYPYISPLQKKDES